MKDDEKLIPELREFRKLNNEDFSIEDWISYEGNIKLTIAYSVLFWPNFIEYDGCVILENRFDTENFENWKNTEYFKSYAQIESVLNHFHILDFWGTDQKRDEATYDQIVYLGNKLCEIYSAKLKVEFPEKQFTFSFNGNEKLEAYDEYEITFYQEENLSRKTKYGT